MLFASLFMLTMLKMASAEFASLDDYLLWNTLVDEAALGELALMVEAVAVDWLTSMLELFFMLLVSMFTLLVVLPMLGSVMGSVSVSVSVSVVGSVSISVSVSVSFSVSFSVSISMSISVSFVTMAGFCTISNYKQFLTRLWLIQ